MVFKLTGFWFRVGAGKWFCLENSSWEVSVQGIVSIPDFVAMETSVECKVRQVLLPETFLDTCVWHCWYITFSDFRRWKVVLAFCGSTSVFSLTDNEYCFDKCHTVSCSDHSIFLSGS